MEVSGGAGDDGRPVGAEIFNEELEVKAEEVSEDEGEHGVRAPKKVANPQMPTKAEIEEHNLTSSAQVLVCALRSRRCRIRSPSTTEPKARECHS